MRKELYARDGSGGTIKVLRIAHRQVNKKDGSNRVCVDFRKLNKITKVDPEPMTTAEDLLRRFSGMKYLSKIHLTKGYWHIPVAPENVYKTVFVTLDGQCEFLLMPF